jgi:hypothetical protein
MSDVVSDLMNTIDELNIKNNDLERQLAEARELVFTAYQEGWNDNRNNLDCWETHWIDSDSRYSLEQLKEQGE